MLIEAIPCAPVSRDWSAIGSDLATLFSRRKRDLYWQRYDMAPALYQVLSYSELAKYRKAVGRRDSRSDLVNAYFYDIQWNGEDTSWSRPETKTETPSEAPL